VTSGTALIAGAGIGGLAAAIALSRAGWRVRVFERASSPRELGFALNLAANAMAALDELGVAQPVLAGGHRTAIAEIRRGDGRTLKRVDLPDAIGGARTVVATRPVLHGALLDALSAAAPEALELGREAIGFSLTGAGVVLRFHDGGEVSGDLLVGADGVASAIRRQLHPGEPAPRESGHYALRGVASGATDLLGGLSAATYLGDGIEASIARAGPDTVYWYMSLLSRDIRDIDGTPAPATLARRFVARLDRTFAAMVEATQPGDLRGDYLFDRDPLPEWGAGVVTLLGDAAHPMLPHTGQGAAQALEDAVALGLALRLNTDPPAALRRYERVRSARTRRLVVAGRRAAWITTTHNPVLRLLRSSLIRLVPAAAMARMFMLAGRGDPHRELRGM
jgi:2-polyprenyl-6-methoxyphenol hydroxylase-like FAD-dependent oxidoreductase